MKKIKFFIAAAALIVCSTTSAQFTNVNSQHKQRNSRTASSFVPHAPEKGYKGFVEAGYTFGVGDYGEGRPTFQTTHGYQFNPYIFAGIGAGFNYFTDSKAIGVPIYADGRLTFINNYITPFLDVKIGYSVVDVEGFFLSPSLGCRFGVGNDTALLLSFGYEMQIAEFQVREHLYRNGYWEVLSSSYLINKNCGGLTLKIGFEF